MNYLAIFAILLLVPISVGFADAKNLEVEPCNNELNKFQKYDGSFVCIKSSSIQKLIERGFITKIMPVYSDHVADFNSKVFFDKDTYTAPDTVLVTILHADHNKNSQEVEEITPDMDLIGIQASRSFVKEFTFTETGVDTGIFKGHFEIISMDDYNDDRTLKTDKNLVVKPKDTIMVEFYIEKFDMKLTGNGIIK